MKRRRKGNKSREENKKVTTSSFILFHLLSLHSSLPSRSRSSAFANFPLLVHVGCSPFHLSSVCRNKNKVRCIGIACHSRFVVGACMRGIYSTDFEMSFVLFCSLNELNAKYGKDELQIQVNISDSQYSNVSFKRINVRVCMSNAHISRVFPL